MIFTKTSKDINKIHQSCRIVSFVLSQIEKEIKPGVTTSYLDKMAEELAYEKGAIPGFKGYRGFPYSICASVNEQIVHGFANDNPLEDGDILSIDFGILYKGWYGDAAFTAPVGEVSPLASKLIKVTKECLSKGIEASKPYNRVGDISSAVQRHAEAAGFNVVKDFTGHGIGRALHEEPAIYNFGKAGEGYMLKPGMVIAIEPMVTEKGEKTKSLNDGWTVVTEDGGLSAHFEHTIAITENGVEVLTNRN